MRLPGLASLTLLAGLFCTPPLHAQTKRALIIGIDTYEPHGRPIPKVNSSDPAGPSRFDLLEWPDLDGAVADAKSMRTLLTGVKFGFPNDDQHVHMLLQNEATRAGILAAMQKYLANEPASGDIVVFYYAGHGSLRYNSKSTKRSNHLDNTIVPSDAYTGAFDVRDREIARIFNAALDKGVKLTAIFDSCHSGTIARGIPLGKQGRARFLAYDPRDINEGPDVANGKEVVAPEDRQKNPALVFSATEPDQLAREWPAGEETHGAFTVALIEALKALPVNTPAIDVYKRVKVVMEGMGLSDQQPILDATQDRAKQPLFSALVSAGNEASKMRVAVASVQDSTHVVLDAGIASDLGPGSELTQVTESGKLGGMRLVVKRVNGLSRSDAEVVAGAGAGSVSSPASPADAQISVGDIFEVTKWVPLQSNALKIWTAPATLSETEIAAYVAEFSALSVGGKIVPVLDPAEQAPTHMMWWDGQQWKLSRARSGDMIALGAKPTVQKIAAALGSATDIRLLINFPPSRELEAELASMIKSSNIEIVEDPRQALYVLVGAQQKDQRSSGLRYGWFNKSAFDKSALETPVSAVRAQGSAGFCSADSPYPLRSDWVTQSKGADMHAEAAGLFSLASRLAKVHSWIDLPTPEGEMADFPYHLALRNLSTGAYVTDSTHAGEKYSLVLRADAKATRPVAPRWVYVLVIDCSGQGQLMFPRGGGENKFPSTEGAPPQEIVLPRATIQISPPFGLDTYVLLVTDQQLPDPDGLSFSAAVTRGVSSPLQQLLSGASRGTRGVSSAEPTDWSATYLHLRSTAGE